MWKQLPAKSKWVEVLLFKLTGFNRTDRRTSAASWKGELRVQLRKTEAEILESTQKVGQKILQTFYE